MLALAVASHPQVSVRIESGGAVRVLLAEGSEAPKHGSIPAAGVGGAFMKVVHCVVIGNDGLVYVCDRQGNRIQVFDKIGNFKRNIWVKTG